MYDLVQKDLYDKLYEEAAEYVLEIVTDNINYKKLEKENKELKEKVTQLETVINKLSHKIILYESNY